MIQKRRIILATTNKNKVEEMTHLLKTSQTVELISQTDLNISDITETGLTFVENAILKARNACQRSGLPAIADDSGLEVDILNGAPGIYSARFAGEAASYAQNRTKLLTALTNVAAEQRTARFQCVIIYLRHAADPTPIICQGTWEGSILFEPRGQNGFGYDPLFFVPTHNCSAAELPLTEKNQISHRALALQQLAKFLKQC